MSRLVDSSISIFEAINNIKAGKYVMPAFQRQYVWGMDQIAKLWDSILLDYPISTFLFWHLDDENITWDTYFCNFMSNVRFNSSKQSDSVEYKLSSVDVKITDTAILDGQQRLTSLYLSLMGEATIRPKNSRKRTDGGIFSKLLIELDENKIITSEDDYNTKKFDIKYTEKIAALSSSQFEIKRILEDEFQSAQTRSEAIEKAISNVSASSKEYARNILRQLCKKIYEDKLIRYTEIFDMNQDDALEMFIRFNSGGKALKKSEITMSILSVYWPSSKEEFGKVLTGSYVDYGTDFIIRAALMLYGSNVTKPYINNSIAEHLKNEWNSFKQALQNLDKALKSFRLDVSQFSRNWNILLPVLYFIYVNPDYDSFLDDIRVYIMRAMLLIYFRSGTPGKLQQMKSFINDNNQKITIDMLDQIPALRVTDGKIEDILNSEKGSTVAYEALHYLSLDWYDNSIKYEEDHLHPYERFNEGKPISVSNEDWKRWRSLRNRLPNLWLLQGRPNASKSDMRLIDYYNDKTEEQKKEFIEHAIIPEPVALEIEDFEFLYENRKEIMVKRLKELLCCK